MMVSMIKIAYVMFIILKSKTYGAADTLFTSLREMETLVETEESVIKTLEEYISAEKDSIEIVDRYLNRTKIEYFKAIQDVSEYLANPINAYSLIKRLTVDLQTLEGFIKKKIGHKKSRIVKYPTEGSLAEAATSLIRLQITYDLNITQLADGVLNYSSRTPVTSSDCYELGLVPAEDQGYSTKIAWMMQALNKLQAENCSICMVKEVSILDHITNGYYQMGDIENTIRWIKKRMVLRPKSEETLKQAKFMRKLQKHLKEQQENILNGQKNKVHDYSKKNPKRKLLPTELSHSVCHAKINVRREIRNRLKCGYLYGPHPFLRLARVKAEVLHLVPDMILVHEVISDTEIRILQFMAGPKLWRDKIHGSNPYKDCPRSFALMNEGSEYVSRITTRISYITGLGMGRADPLKMINYGIGGHCNAHHDFYSNGSAVPPEFLVKGDKIVTVMLYMSNVEQGGATMFQKLGLKVHPIKGAALIWQNLHPSGDGNYEMMHQACPVLRGSKWIAIKWAREIDQKYCPVWRTSQGIMTEEMYQKLNIHEPFRDDRYEKKVIVFKPAWQATQ